MSNPTATDDASDEPPKGGVNEEVVIDQVIVGHLSPDAAASILEIPIGQVLRLARERSSADGHPPASKEIAEKAGERFDENWSKAQEGAEPQAEELPPVDLAIQSFPIARWLFGSDRRRMTTAIVACAALGCGVYYLATKEGPPAPAPRVEEPAPSSGLPTAGQREVAVSMAKQFLAAATWEEKVDFVWDPTTTKPLMIDWYEKRAMPLLVDREPALQLAAESVRSGIGFVILNYLNDDGSKSILPVRLDGGTAKVLWQATTNYQPMDWHQYGDQRPPTAFDFRLRVKAIETPEEFAEFGLLFFELSPPEPNAIPLLGVAHEESKTTADLNVLTDFREKVGNGILRIQFTAGAPGSAVEIQSVERMDWLN